MYYILNETNQLIAADEEMLSLCKVAHIDELASDIAKDDINLHLTEGEVIIRIKEAEHTYPATTTSLFSLLGYLHLIQISTDSVSEDDISIQTPTLEEDSSELIDSIIDEAQNEVSLDVHMPKEEEHIAIEAHDEDAIMPLLSDDKDEITLGDHLDSEDNNIQIVEEENETELFALLDDTQTDEKETEDTPTPEATEEEILDLGVSDTQEDFLKEETQEVSEININVDATSQKIGITPEDYHNFLNEFIDTALGLEKDLQSDNQEKRAEATITLTHLSDVLHIPVIGDIIETIQDAKEAELFHTIESFYSTLSRITTTQHTQENTSSDVQESETPEKLELFDAPSTTHEPQIQEEVKPRKASSGQSFGTITLEGIKPKHFDFQLEEAANDLSLPVELIEEFVHDFIAQAHLETKKMLEAYEDGDLETIQKIGHLLKGASSNLRITPLSETLYNIQFCEDPSKLEMLIKDYWAHFLSFENQINVISN